MGRKKGREVSGWLVVDKPAGITSTSVVNKVRWAFDAKKAGHAGTLDPAATGVLAVALGEATKTVPYITDALKCYRFAVIETLTFDMQKPTCRFASQSGPMLVIGGELHPRFLVESDSLYIRNGVGVSADGKTAYFAISNAAVNFYVFARLFRDGLGAPNALFFDGHISRLYAPQLGRSDIGFPIGPMVGVVKQRN